MTTEEFNALEKGDTLYKISCWKDGIVRTDHVVCFKGKGREAGSIEVALPDWRPPVTVYAAELKDWHTTNGLEAAMLDLASKVIAHKIQKCRNQIAASQLKLDDLLTKQPSDIIQLPESHKEKVK